MLGVVSIALLLLNKEPKPMMVTWPISASLNLKYILEWIKCEEMGTLHRYSNGKLSFLC